MLDHVVVLGAPHLWELMKNYMRYYSQDRSHYSLKNKETPIFRKIQHKPAPAAKVIALPRVYGLHHHYEWRQTA